MASMNFNTANQTFRQLLGNGLVYKIPKFQRDYSWTADEWDDLWQDIVGLFDGDGEEGHYMGYLVLQSSDNKCFDVIDGQQRLTTFSIMILSAISIMTELSNGQNEDADKNKKRAEQLRNSYIGYLNPVTLVPQSKLELNRHNNKFYQNFLVPLESLPQRGLSASEHLLRKAFGWFREKIKDYANNDGEKTAGFIDSLVDKLFFTVITVTDELNAFKVFETLNARGVKLSATDLLKNYLFSMANSEGAHDTEMKNLEDRWEEIVGILGSESFPEFLRVFWNSQNKLVRKADLFKTIRKNIADKAHTFELIRKLDENARIYAALRNPNDESWLQDERSYLEKLQMFNVCQPFSLLLAAYKIFADEKREDFERLLRSICMLSFRYNVICSMQTNELERIYNDAAVRLSSGELNTVQDILQLLQKAYPQDDAFRAAFTDKELRTSSSRNKKVMRYILFELEKQLSGNDYDSNSDKYNIEHILPENPGSDWPDYDEHRDDKFIYRLGNMTLLEKSENRDMGNSGYTAKQGCYRDSRFGITVKISEDYNQWDGTKINSHQLWMAKQATSIWRISFAP
ncbi:MAG: DUF262 domain-containing protein [Planctomycetota bacterium]|nr:MAG: DUF262 domain-containing protein [Planctomycetota bacterium]